MSQKEARDYVDLVIEGLVEQGILSSDRYGKITEDQSEELADRVKARSEE